MGSRTGAGMLADLYSVAEKVDRALCLSGISCSLRLFRSKSTSKGGVFHLVMTMISARGFLPLVWKWRAHLS
jgi:hypothetical protein